MRTWTLRGYLPSLNNPWMAMLFSCLLLVLIGDTAKSADTVKYIRSAKRSAVTQQGTIIDYTGASLTLELAGGRRVQIPTDKIIAVETVRSDSQRAADRLLLDGHPAQALTLYRRAVRDEQRAWMRRWILADMCRCYAQLGQLPQACDTFLILVHSDPATPWFDAIPLCWTARPVPSDMQQRAESWIESSSAVEQLLAASWLLTISSQRTRAVAQLQHLTAAPDRRIAGLASAQLWRTSLATATGKEVAQWQAAIDGLPTSLRAGPYYLLGLALARLGRRQDAALALMRIPILFSKQRMLAAEALWTAGQQLERLKQPDEAVRVYRELANRHDDCPLASTARARINTLLHDH